MQSSSFDESNGYLNPPRGMSAEQVEALSVYRGHNNIGAPVTISCWKPSKEELDEINRTGRVWLHVLGHTMFPSFLSGHHPFSPRPEESVRVEMVEPQGLIIDNFLPFPHPGDVWLMEQAFQNGITGITVAIDSRSDGDPMALLTVAERVIQLRSIKYVTDVFIYNSDEQLRQFIKESSLHFIVRSTLNFDERFVGDDLLPILCVGVAEEWSEEEILKRVRGMG